MSGALQDRIKNNGAVFPQVNTFVAKVPDPSQNRILDDADSESDGYEIKRKPNTTSADLIQRIQLNPYAAMEEQNAEKTELEREYQRAEDKQRKYFVFLCGIFLATIVSFKFKSSVKNLFLRLFS